MEKIADVFDRQVGRTIEKVIDYYARDDARLEREIREYEVTDNVSRCFRKFLDNFEAGVRTGEVTEVGIWVFGYYGSGKSSFTKYLGFALDHQRTVNGRPFRKMLSERLNDPALEATLNALSERHKPAVIMLDLAAQQLADMADAPVSTVLYYQVLQALGYSGEKKLAQLELKLEERNQYDAFKQAYHALFQEEWLEVHNDAMLALGGAAELVPRFFPREYPTPDSFRSARWEEALDAREQVRRMLDLIHRWKPGCDAILFLVDEAGQYVAPKGSLILNLDGLIRNMKELGKGKVWMMATGQQTLQEIVEKAALNSAELNKLRDRFPISIELEASDIREITRRRLLTKSAAGTHALRDLYLRFGQATLNHTRLVDTRLFKGDPSAEDFERLYPFLPQHFDLLLELIRVLARTTGGVGLRSAIRVIQDLLVDTSRTLPKGKAPVADRPLGSLATLDDFYDTLRQDIRKVLPHVVQAVERIDRLFGGFSIEEQTIRRVARAIAALQPIEGIPRHEANLAALLYPQLGAPGLQEQVQLALQTLVGHKECGVFNDPQSGGYLFLSDEIRPLRDKRNACAVTSADLSSLRESLLRTLFDPPPSVILEGVKKVQAGIQYLKTTVLPADDILFRIEPAEYDRFEGRRTALLSETNTPEYRNAIVWLMPIHKEIDDLLTEAYRSQFILREKSDESQKAIAQFLRSEERLKSQNLERARRELQTCLANGVLFFRGLPRPVGEVGPDLGKAAETVLKRAAEDIFPHLRLGAKKVSTEAASNFLKVERLDRVSSDLDPLGFVARKGGRSVVDKAHPTLAETMRAFQLKVEESGAGRLQGSQLQDLFATAPYGWTKDTARYVFAGLLVAGEIQLHTPDGVLKTAGPKAAEALKSTLSFNRIGVSLRDGRPSLEALDRAATRLEQMFAIEILPLEDHISRAVRVHVPREIEAISSIPDRLRLLGLSGSERARKLAEIYADLLKDDAGGATAHLGGRDSTIAADRQWARDIENCLKNGGEAQIQHASALLEQLRALDGLFPGSALELCPPEELRTLQNVLASERFFERMSDLRGAVDRVMGRLRAAYSSRREELNTRLKGLMEALEAIPGWSRLTEDDLAYLADRMKHAEVAEQVREGREFQDFQRVLLRRAELAGLQHELLTELGRRVAELLANRDKKDETLPSGDDSTSSLQSPAPSVPDGGGTQAFSATRTPALGVAPSMSPSHGVADHAPATTTLGIGRIVQSTGADARTRSGSSLSSAVLDSKHAVAVWLEALRPQLDDLVETSSPVHVELTRK